MIRLDTTKKKIGMITAISGLVMSAFAAVSRVEPGEFAIRETFYRMTSDIIKPGIHPQVPFVQFTHNFETNTQRAEIKAGSCRFWPLCNSTKDGNALTAEVALNYKVLPDAQKLGFHLWSMDGFIMPDGYWLVTRMLNDSANAVMGRYDMAQIMANPEKFAKELKEDLIFRLQQNNIPVEIESLELKSFSTSYEPVKSVNYVTMKNALKP